MPGSPTTTSTNDAPKAIQDFSLGQSMYKAKYPPISRHSRVLRAPSRRWGRRGRGRGKAHGGGPSVRPKAAPRLLGNEAGVDAPSADQRPVAARLHDATLPPHPRIGSLFPRAGPGTACRRRVGSGLSCAACSGPCAALDGGSRQRVGRSVATAAAHHVHDQDLVGVADSDQPARPPLSAGGSPWAGIPLCDDCDRDTMEAVSPTLMWSP